MPREVSIDSICIGAFGEAEDLPDLALLAGQLGGAAWSLKNYP